MASVEPKRVLKPVTSNSQLGSVAKEQLKEKPSRIPEPSSGQASQIDPVNCVISSAGTPKM